MDVAGEPMPLGCIHSLLEAASRLPGSEASQLSFLRTALAAFCRTRWQRAPAAATPVPTVKRALELALVGPAGSLPRLGDAPSRTWHDLAYFLDGSRYSKDMSPRECRTAVVASLSAVRAALTPLTGPSRRVTGTEERKSRTMCPWPFPDIAGATTSDFVDKLCASRTMRFYGYRIKKCIDTMDADVTGTWEKLPHEVARQSLHAAMQRSIDVTGPTDFPNHFEGLQTVVHEVKAFLKSNRVYCRSLLVNIPKSTTYPLTITVDTPGLASTLFERLECGNLTVSGVAVTPVSIGESVPVYKALLYELKTRYTAWERRRVSTGTAAPAAAAQDRSARAEAGAEEEEEGDGEGSGVPIHPIDVEEGCLPPKLVAELTERLDSLKTRALVLSGELLVGGDVSLPQPPPGALPRAGPGHADDADPDAHAAAAATAPGGGSVSAPALPTGGRPAPRPAGGGIAYPMINGYTVYYDDSGDGTVRLGAGGGASGSGGDDDGTIVVLASLPTPFHADDSLGYAKSAGGAGVSRRSSSAASGIPLRREHSAMSTASSASGGGRVPLVHGPSSSTTSSSASSRFGGSRFSTTSASGDETAELAWFAAKLLPAEVLGAYKAEAKVAMRNQMRGITRFLSHGIVAGRPCLIYQLCLGSLADVMLVAGATGATGAAGRDVHASLLSFGNRHATMVSLMHTVQRLHGQDVVHRNITPHGVLFDLGGSVVLGDLSLARMRREGRTGATASSMASLNHSVTSSQFTLPREVVTRQAAAGFGGEGEGGEEAKGPADATAECMVPYDESTDVFMLGCTLAYLWGDGRFPYRDGALHCQQAAVMAKERPNLEAHGVPPMLWGLLEWMLDHRHRQRATIEEAVNHPSCFSHAGRITTLLQLYGALPKHGGDGSRFEVDARRGWRKELASSHPKLLEAFFAKEDSSAAAAVEAMRHVSQHIGDARHRGLRPAMLSAAGHAVASVGSGAGAGGGSGAGGAGVVTHNLDQWQGEWKGVTELLFRHRALAWVLPACYKRLVAPARLFRLGRQGSDDVATLTLQVKWHASHPEGATVSAALVKEKLGPLGVGVDVVPIPSATGKAGEIEFVATALEWTKPRVSRLGRVVPQASKGKSRRKSRRKASAAPTALVKVETRALAGSLHLARHPQLCVAQAATVDQNPFNPLLFVLITPELAARLGGLPQRYDFQSLGNPVACVPIRRLVSATPRRGEHQVDVVRVHFGLKGWAPSASAERNRLLAGYYEDARTNLWRTYELACPLLVRGAADGGDPGAADDRFARHAAVVKLQVALNPRAFGTRL